MTTPEIFSYYKQTVLGIQYLHSMVRYVLQPTQVGH